MVRFHHSLVLLHLSSTPSKTKLYADRSSILSSFPADGSIFEVVSKGRQIFISGFDVNMDTGTDTVSVYTRPGYLVPMNDGGWALIKTFQVEGQGKGLVTSLPDFVYPFIIPPGQMQSFYIATNSTDIDFWYSDGSDLGTVFASNDDLMINEGYAIGHNWRGYASPRQWNGAVRYTVLADDPTASPVVEPTDVPTASPVEPNDPTEPAVSSTPSAAPSLKVCQYVSLICIQCVCLASTDSSRSLLLRLCHLSFQPSSYPSLLPTSGFVPPTADATATTQSPTKSPTKQPTQSEPTQSEPTQSEPTASPVPTTTNFKEPRSGTTLKPTEAPASSSQRATYSAAWTAIACLSLAITKKWF